RDPIGQLHVTPRLWAVFYESKHPLTHASEIGVTALRKGTQQIQRSGGLPIGFDLPTRVWAPSLLGEGVVIDNVASVARQFLAVALLGWSGTRLGKLTGDTADFDDRRSGCIGQHNRHLQEHPEKVADIVGAMFGKAFRAVATLQ